jgi:hypothetical protein
VPCFTLLRFAAYVVVRCAGHGGSTGDLDECVFATVKQLTNVGGEVKEGGPKTHHSDGVVVLDKATVGVLRGHRTRQEEEWREWGRAWTDMGRIFAREDGRDLQPDWVGTYFGRLTFKAGLPPIRLHDL